MDPGFLHADCEDSDQTELMSRLNQSLLVSRSNITGFSCSHVMAF